MAFTSQEMNTFVQGAMLGALDLIPTPNVIAARILSTSTATAIQQGSAVKLVDGTGAVPVVDVCTGPTDGPVFGVITYSPRKNLYVKGDVVQVALDNSAIFLKAGGAISRGDKVTCTAATTSADPYVTTVSSAATQYVTGIALDKIASGALGRIRIVPSLNGAV